MTARAVRFLAERGRCRERPFCLVVGLLLPHNPYVCSRALFEHYLAVLPEVATEAPAGEHPAVQALRRTRGLTGVDPQDARRARAAYYGLVETLDASVGQVLAALDRAGLGTTTHVVYTSDHGDLNGEHAMWAKSSFYEGAVGVPWIWRGPGIRAGAELEQVASLLELAPTLLDLAGAAPLPAARGSSLRLLLECGSDPAWPGRAFAESCAVGCRPARMVREGRWKLCLYHGYDEPQLFDLVADPDETRDLGRAPEHAAVRERLLALATDGWNGQAAENWVAGEDIARAGRQGARGGSHRTVGLPGGSERAYGRPEER